MKKLLVLIAFFILSQTGNTQFLSPIEQKMLKDIEADMLPYPFTMLGGCSVPSWPSGTAIFKLNKK